MRFLSLILALSSFSALACPNLAGQYAVCRSTTGATSGSSDVLVSQRIENGVTIYSITSTDDETGERDTSEFPADGQIYNNTEVQDGMEITTSTMIACAGNALNMVSSSTVDSQPLMNLNMLFTRTSSNSVTQEISGDIFGQPIQDTVICQ